MAVLARPYGLYVRKCKGARRNTAGNTHYPVPANVAGTMYYGAPVELTGDNAVVGPVAASPTSAAPVLGVVQGAQWLAANAGLEFFPSLPGGAYTAGHRKIEVMINDDPDLVMMIQADGNTNLTDETCVGKVAAIKDYAAGNDTTGRSTASLESASVAASGDKALRIIRILNPGDPYPDLLVIWNGHVHVEAPPPPG